MGKEAKTNAMRMLEKKKIKYEVLQYECDEFIDGLHTSEMNNTPPEQSFKTLVMRGKSGQHYVFVLPVAEETDLKKAARAAGEKSMEMIHVKELTPLTGYVRGGCSPLGMKKLFTTFIHSSALDFAEIYVSGGRIGLSLKVAPQDLAGVTGAKFADIIAEKA